jgi:hypothetical protein
MQNEDASETITIVAIGLIGVVLFICVMEIGTTANWNKTGSRECGPLGHYPEEVGRWRDFVDYWGLK